VSVCAFIQSPHNDGTILFAKDGILIQNPNEISKYIKKMENFFKYANNKPRPTYIENGNYRIFVNFHKVKDVSNRRREFLLYWNSTDSEDMIVNTAKQIDITNELNFDKLKKDKSSTNIFLYIIVITIVIFLYKIFQE
jgi:hypothetical protein